MEYIAEIFYAIFIFVIGFMVFKHDVVKKLGRSGIIEKDFSGCYILKYPKKAEFHNKDLVYDIDVDEFFEKGVLNTESNVQFGEGGAGTFSDGKLTTNVNNDKIKKIINELIAAGAPEEIAYLSKPHVGTDKLIDVLKKMRKKIEELGGEYRFCNKLISVTHKNEKISCAN